jgi:hypothetical protein
MIIESYITETLTPDNIRNRARVSVVGGEVLLDIPFTESEKDTVKTLVCAIRVLEQRLQDAGLPLVNGIV